jgi:hypothetical protein
MDEAADAARIAQDAVTDLHHMVPREILRQLPEEVARTHWYEDEPAHRTGGVSPEITM